VLSLFLCLASSYMVEVASLLADADERKGHTMLLLCWILAIFIRWMVEANLWRFIFFIIFFCARRARHDG